MKKVISYFTRWNVALDNALERAKKRAVQKLEGR